MTDDDDKYPIRQRPGESPVAYAERIKWTGVRPIAFDDGSTIRNCLALTYQVEPQKIRIR